MEMKFRIFRFDADVDREPHYQEYSVSAEPGERILDCLNRIKWEQDGTLSYRMSCAHGVCGSDGMKINGSCRLACQALVKDYQCPEVVLEPLPGFRVLKDLLVDMEKFLPGVANLAAVTFALAGVLGGIGAGLGFLWFNAYPAQVFMGDVGALALGAVLGVIAVIVRQEIVLFIMGGVFVVETVSVMLQVSYFKWTKGKRIFRMAPLHHHFELSGWKETQVVVRFWIISMMLVLIGLSTLKLR